MAAGAVLAVASAACSEGGARVGVPSATVGTAPATTTTTDPYAIPAVIDSAYVNRVLEALDQAYGDIVRLVMQTRQLPPEATTRLRSLYARDELLQLQVDAFQLLLARGFPTYKSPSGDQHTQVQELISSTPLCIFARVSRDYSAVREATSQRSEWVALVPKEPSRDEAHMNPTRWAYQYDGFPPPGVAEPRNQCS